MTVQNLGRNLLLVLVFAVGVYLLLFLFSGVGELREAFRSFNWAALPLILGLVAVSYAVRYLRWRYYLSTIGVHIPDRRVDFAIFVSGLSMTISPGKLGEVLKSLFVRQVTGAPVARTAPAVVAERATDGTGMILWGLLGALAFNFGPGLLLLFLAVTVAGIVVLRSHRLSLLV